MTEEKIHEFMKLALEEASKSPDPSTQNGAIIVYYDGLGEEFEVVGRGFNTFHMGVDAALPLVDKETKNVYIEHAERMAIYNMVSNLHDGFFEYTEEWGDQLIMFCTDAPCNACANAIVGTSIKTVYTFNPQRDESSWKKQCDAGANIIKLTGGEINYIGSYYKYGIQLLKSGNLKEY